MQLTARRYDNGQPVTLTIADGKVRHVAGGANGDTKLPWVAPGFVDVQVNGFFGLEFSSAKRTADEVERIVTHHWSFGVTQICPTVTTQSFEVLAHGVKTIAAAAERSPQLGRLIAGIHVEGPYFSSEDGPRGAHPKEHCRAPDWDEFQRLQEAAGGRIVILTMSPEFDNAAEFIEQVVASGVVVAVGHTGADSDQIRAAVDAGARLSTHLGNGAHGQIRRHPNYIWDQLAEDRLVASLIVDGHHLPPEVVQSMVRAKTPGRVILVSDESGLAGQPPGRYDSSGGGVEILEDGRIVIAGQRQLLAGASKPISDCVANVIDFAGVDLATAVEMASVQPARLIDRPCGGLRPGDPADLLLFDLDVGNPAAGLQVRQTIQAGEAVYS